MLKGINPIISPELLKILMEMGHGDEIVFCDRNFPAASMARNLVRYDACNSILTILDAILPLFPLDYAAQHSLVLMHPAVKQATDPPIWEQFINKVSEYPDGEKKPLIIERLEFIERSKNAYCIVLTGETARCGNVLIKKGVVPA